MKLKYIKLVNPISLLMNRLKNITLLFFIVLTTSSCFQSALVYDNEPAATKAEEYTFIKGHWVLISQQSVNNNYIFLNNKEALSYNLLNSKLTPQIEKLYYNFSPTQKRINLKKTESQNKDSSYSYNLYSITEHLLKTIDEDQNIHIYKRHKPFDKNLLYKEWILINPNNQVPQNYLFNKDGKGFQTHLSLSKGLIKKEMTYHYDDTLSLLYCNVTNYNTSKIELAIVVDLTSSLLKLLTKDGLLYYQPV